MDDPAGPVISNDQEGPSALVAGARNRDRTMSPREREQILNLGGAFAEQQKEKKGAWLLISGELTSEAGNGVLDPHTGLPHRSTDGWIRDSLRAAFGYPDKGEESRQTPINLLLDSVGGNLDSAYTTVLYLRAYTDHLRVFVPRSAKSASTLFAIGGNELFMSKFAELGPLDTQLPDPRNAVRPVSALDCYRSVDYVRNFGIDTMKEVLTKLIQETEKRVPIQALINEASTYSIRAIKPMLEKVAALDFGGWGRSLQIGETYAQKLLRLNSKDPDEAEIRRIAHRLVFGYTHHLFPIDFKEAEDIGLKVLRMDSELYDQSMELIRKCEGKNFYGFISHKEAKAVKDAHLDEASGFYSPEIEGTRQKAEKGGGV